MILKFKNNTITYPVDLRTEFPSTIFPASLRQDHLPDGYFLVEPVEQPSVRFGSVSEATPELVGGVYRQVWAVTEMSPVDAKLDLIREIDIQARAVRDSVVSLFSPAEMASWSIKWSEAVKYTTSGLEADAPFLAAEASVRGCSLAELATKVITKAGLFSQLEAHIAGIAGKKQDKVKAAGSLAELEVIATAILDGWMPQ
jgi:hypothetical protein